MERTVNINNGTSPDSVSCRQCLLCGRRLGWWRRDLQRQFVECTDPTEHCGAFTDVSCPSASFCAAVEWNGLRSYLQRQCLGCLLC